MQVCLLMFRSTPTVHHDTVNTAGLLQRFSVVRANADYYEEVFSFLVVLIYTVTGRGVWGRITSTPVVGVWRPGMRRVIL